MSILIFIIWHQKCFWAKFLELQPSGWLYLRTKQFLNLTNFPSTSFFPIFSTPFNYLHHFKPPFSTNFSTTVLSYFVNPRNQLVFFFFCSHWNPWICSHWKRKKKFIGKKFLPLLLNFPPSLSGSSSTNGYVGIDLGTWELIWFQIIGIQPVFQLHWTCSYVLLYTSTDTHI